MNNMDPLTFLPEAIAYLEHEYKCSVQPLEHYLYTGDTMFYLNGARLWKLQHSYYGDKTTPIIISLEKIFS